MRPWRHPAGGRCHTVRRRGRYFRLTAAPDPADVRPVAVLKLALARVLGRAYGIVVARAADGGDAAGGDDGGAAPAGESDGTCDASVGAPRVVDGGAVAPSSECVILRSSGVVVVWCSDGV